MKVLVTGFELDEVCPVNTSNAVLKELAASCGPITIVTEELRADYRHQVEMLDKLWEKHHPDAIICLGQALRREVISLEKVAINFQDGTPRGKMGADYFGFIPDQRKVAEDGPDGYFTNLPIERMLRALKSECFPCEISLTAGAVSCNTAMYSVMHLIATRHPETLGGFIHIPAHHEHPGRVKKSYSLSYIARGIETAIRALAED